MAARGPNRGIGSWIERRATIAPETTALIVRGRAVTYAEFALRVRRAANALADLGVQRGDRVVWLGPNHAAFLETLFGAALGGAVLAPINHLLDADEVEMLIAEYEPALVVQHAAVDHEPRARITRVFVDSERDEQLHYEQVLDGASDDPVEATVGFDDVCLVAHSSGTTGRPKGIMLSHGNVTWNAINMIASTSIRSDDVTIAIAPFFRTGGTGVNVLPVLFQGGAVVVPNDSSPAGILKAMERERVTVGFANPDLLDALASSPGWPTSDLSALRFMLTGGAPVPERLIRLFDARGIRLAQGYGLSEAGPVTHVLRPDDALSRIGSAGKPVLMVDARVDSAAGAEAAPGETGELLVRGPNVMIGYWRNATATAEALSDDGWLRTGDAARVDADGYFWIVGRMADAFEADGRLVHPGDLERRLSEHPAVRDVAVAAVSAGGRTRIVALVVASGEISRDEVIALGVDDVAFVAALPRSSVGKVMRRDVALLASSVVAA